MQRRHFLSLTALAVAARAAEPAKMRVAVIGHTGQGDYGHGVDTMWLNLPETEIVGFADADDAGRAKEEKKLKGVKSYADYKQLLAATKPDLVAICSRHVGEHRAMALAAIEAGARGLYFEKPFARDLAECDEIMAAAAPRHVKIAIAHRNRYNPTLQAVDKVIADGKIGRILEVRARGKEDPRGGALDFWVLGSHVLNMVMYFGGKPKACTGMLYQGDRPATPSDVVQGAEDVGPIAGDALYARYEMERGFPFYFETIKGAGNKAAGFGYQIIGTEGLIDFRADAVQLPYLVPGSPFKPANEPRPWIPITTAGPGQPEPLTDISQNVMGHLAGARDLIAAVREDKKPVVSAEDGRLIIEMIFAVFQSHIKNGARVTFPIEGKTNPLASWK